MTAWNETQAALDLLCRIDAFERSSDCWSGRGWEDLAGHFAANACDAETELANLRADAVKAMADASGAPQWSDEWLTAHDDADTALVTVKEAIERARRLRFGDGLLEEAA